MLRRITLSLCLLVVVPFTTAANVETLPAALQSTQMVVSMRPIALLAQELTEGLPVEITTLLPAGATPHDYALKPSDLRLIAGADLLVWLGEQGESYLAGVVDKARVQIEWAEVPGMVHLAPRSAMHNAQGSHQSGHHHDAQYDLHFWFGVDNAIALINTMEKTLLASNPQLNDGLANNKSLMIKRLQQQRSQSKALLAQGAGPFLLSHDAYYYLEEDLGIHSEGAISLDPEIKPGVKHLMAIKDRIKADKVRCVISDPSVSDALLNKVDTQPPMKRISIDPLAWDYQGKRFSEWLSSIYVKMVVCTTASS